MMVTEEPSDFPLQRVHGSNLEEGRWYFDIGVSNHMTRRINLFHEQEESYDGSIRFGDGLRIMIHGKRDILLNC